MDILFEPAKPEDALKLIEVQDLSFYDDFQKYGECPSYQEKAENMVKMIRHAIVYKIILNGEIIGDLIIRNRGNGTYYLRTFAVIPQYQNLGIGTQAMEFIERDNPDGKVWLLITPKNSRRNRHFYEKMGYQKVGEEYHSECLSLIQYKKEIRT